MYFCRGFWRFTGLICLLLAGCAGRGYGPTSLRGSPPIHMGRPPVYSPVTGPVLPSRPSSGTPTSPNQPTGPSADQPTPLDLSLSPTQQQALLRRNAGQTATLGQMIDGRTAPLGIPRATPQKAAYSPDMAHQPSSTSGEPITLASGVAANPQQDLKYRGGKTIKDLTYLNIFIGGPTRWNDSDRQWIDYALEAAATDPHLNHVLMQYFDGQPISADFRGSFWMSGYQPQRVTQANIRQVAKLLYQQGSFNGMPLGSSVINFFLPPGVVLEDPDLGSSALSSLARTIAADKETNSANGLGGYHGSVRIDAKTTVYYSVIAYSERTATGKVNGIPAFAEPWKSITATAYQELQEVRTDPDVDDALQSGQERYLGWTSDRGQEIADGPVETAQPLSSIFVEVPLADGSGAVPVQLLYSNEAHGPEGPIAQPYSGAPLPPAKRRTPRPGSSGGTPTPNPSGPDPWLQYIDKEWSQLPDAVKKQVIQLIQQSLQPQPFGT